MSLLHFDVRTCLWYVCGGLSARLSWSDLIWSDTHYAHHYYYAYHYYYACVSYAIYSGRPKRRPMYVLLVDVRYILHIGTGYLASPLVTRRPLCRLPYFSRPPKWWPLVPIFEHYGYVRREIACYYGAATIGAQTDNGKLPSGPAGRRRGWWGLRDRLLSHQAAELFGGKPWLMVHPY